MSEVVVISMSQEQLSSLLTRKIEEAKQGFAKLGEEYKKVDTHLVDRTYLRRNFGWGKTRIERFETEGKLVPESSILDAKTHLYKLSDCIRLHSILP